MMRKIILATLAGIAIGFLLRVSMELLGYDPRTVTAFMRPSAGAIRAVKDKTVLYAGSSRWDQVEEAHIREHAGIDPYADHTAIYLLAGEAMVLEWGTPVKILSTGWHGHEVIVLGGKHRGVIGCLIDSSLDRRANIQTQKVRIPQAPSPVPISKPTAGLDTVTSEPEMTSQKARTVQAKPEVEEQEVDLGGQTYSLRHGAALYPSRHDLVGATARRESGASSKEVLGNGVIWLGEKTPVQIVANIEHKGQLLGFRVQALEGEGTSFDGYVLKSTIFFPRKTSQ